MIVREGMLLALSGAAAGVAGAWGLTRLLGSLLFGVTPLDPVSFAAVPVVLLAVSLASVLIPAVRATRIDPVVALKGD
jgi:ABC-type antimicrobial peptide transport system permease subunit